MGVEVTTGDGKAMAVSASRLTSAQVDLLLERLGQLVAVLSANGAGRGPQAMLDTLERLEQRDLQSFNALDMFATALKSVSGHLAHLRNSVHSANGTSDAKLDALITRLEEIGANPGAGGAPDMAALDEALEAIVQRLAGLEEKLERQPSAWPFDADAFATALAGVADRLERVEAKMDRAAQQPTLEPEGTTALLNAIAERVARMEDKVDSGADGTSIAACLMAVDRRLSSIETRLGMDRPMPEADPLPDLPEPAPARGSAPPPPPPLPVIEGKPRERVDQLLEQVFRVLSR